MKIVQRAGFQYEDGIFLLHVMTHAHSSAIELRVEVAILSKLKHPNITGLVDFMEDPEQF